MKYLVALAVALAAAAAALAEVGIRGNSVQNHDIKSSPRSDLQTNSVQGCFQQTSKLRNSNGISRDLRKSSFNASGSTSNDPVVSIAFAPSAQIKDSCFAPRHDDGKIILVEALSMLSHYALLAAEDFDKGAVPFIPGPIDDPPLFQSFRKPEMGIFKLMARIQAPNHPDYPMLARIGAGSYICTVSQRWSNFSADVELYKPYQTRH